MTAVEGFWRRALRHRSFAIGALLTGLLVAAALLSLVWAPYPPAEIDIPNKLAPPSAAHWLGTDSLGRDIASQILVGSQNSIVVGVVAVSIGLGFGVALGLWASARRGWVEELVMRFADFAFAFPALLTAIMLTAIYGPGLLMSIVAIGLFNVPVFARLTRGAANAVWTREYVLAARATGVPPLRMLVKHIIPATIPPLLVIATVEVGLVIIAEASLSFLGLGVPAGQPSWGQMVAIGRDNLNTAWWMATMPGAALSLVVLSIGLFGDQVRDELDPRARKR